MPWHVGGWISKLKKELLAALLAAYGIKIPVLLANTQKTTKELEFLVFEDFERWWIRGAMQQEMRCEG